MKIVRKYHFYAGHRNKEAGEKCGRIHGHTYDVEVEFKIEKLSNGVGILFDELDRLTEPIIKEMDHYLLLHAKDPLADALRALNEPFYELPFITSAENLSIWIFSRIKNETGLPICKIKLSETKSSTIVYEP